MSLAPYGVFALMIQLGATLNANTLMSVAGYVALVVAMLVFWIFFYIWIRWTLPRYRYDQLMRLGWKVFLPISLAWVVLTAGFLVAFDKVP